MAVALLLSLLGAFGAPLFGGYVAQGIGWRWVIGVIAIAVGVLHVISVVFLCETYAPVLLRRQFKLHSLRRNTVTNSFPGTKAGTALISFQSLLRPARILFASPILLIVSFYLSV